MPFDPTRTGKLRSAFRAEAHRRVRTMLTHVRQALVEQDFLALRSVVLHPSYAYSVRQAPSLQTKLVLFSNFVNQMAYMLVVQEGGWLRVHIDRAFMHGVTAARKWGSYDVDITVQALYYQFARNELEGIIDATVQVVTRATANAILKKQKPASIYRLIVEQVRKVTLNRINSMVNQIVVQQHNLGRIAQFRTAGITHVGIIPEHIPAPFAKRFLVPVKDLEPGESVNVLTAGDDDVCENCEEIAAAGPYEFEEAEELLPAHPNCRCAVVPAEDRRFATNRELRRHLREEELEEIEDE